MTRHVISARRKRSHGHTHREVPKALTHQPSSQSASLTPLQAGTRKLSPAPQIHQQPSWGESCRGSASWRVVSPATLTLLVGGSPLTATVNPASRHAAARVAASTSLSKFTQALKVVP